MLFITLRFYTSGLGLRWPSSWARLAQVSATRQRYRCHRFGTLLQWGIRFLSGVRLSCFDYSRVTRVRVLLTFILRACVLCAFWLRGESPIVTPYC